MKPNATVGRRGEVAPFVPIVAMGGVRGRTLHTVCMQCKMT